MQLLLLDSDKSHTSVTDDKVCVVASAGEESEEEDEWNYYKSNNNQEQQNLVDVNSRLDNNTEDLTSNPQDPLEPVHLEHAPENSNFEAKSPEEANELQNITNQDTQFEEVASIILPNAYTIKEADVKVKEEVLYSEDEVIKSRLPSPKCISRSATCKEFDFQIEDKLLDSLPVNESSEVKELQTVIDRTNPKERPDSLSFEMESKLNPEAKEFVPTGSPTRSNPTSPVTDCPKPLQNAYLMLSDDAVIAQSPKKSNTMMDNIDVPAEDDFKHGMDNRPHELEQASEYTNGNGNENAIHTVLSPTGEPSYQELNLKEAMQSDEKLDYEYKDVQNALMADNPTDGFDDKIINLIVKENNAMNMSFYEGRDETSLTNNCDDLNKVQLLPDIEEPVQKNDSAYENESGSNSSIGIVKESAALVKRQPQLFLEEDNLMNENPASSILAAASQVVHDVTTLVDQIQLDEPAVNHSMLAIDALPLAEKTEKIETSNIVLCGDQQSQSAKQIEGTENLLCVDQHPLIETALLDSNNSVIPAVEKKEVLANIESLLDSNSKENFLSDFNEPNNAPVRAESNDAVSFVTEESLQQEVITENEFITDESVLNVPSPTQAASTLEVKVKITNRLDTQLNEDAIPVPIELVSENTDNLVPLKTPVVADFKKESELQTKAVSATIHNKPLVASKAKPTSGGVTLKALTVKASTITSKVFTNSPPKPTTTADPKSVAPVAFSRMSVTSKTSTTRKPTSTGTSDNRMSKVNKITGEKKVVPPVKKASISGATTRTSLATQPARNMVSTKSTTATGSNGSTITKSTIITTNKTVKSPAASAKTAKTSSAIVRTSADPSSNMFAKPRTMLSKSAGTALASATTTTTSTVSKSSLTSSTTAMRTGRAQTGSQRTISSVPTTVAIKSSAITSSTITATKTSNTFVASAGLRKSGVLPNKKITSVSSVIKTAKVSTAATAKKDASVKHQNDANKLPSDDLNKQQKNDNNQLITNNGIETQMIVIDSATD